MTESYASLVFAARDRRLTASDWEAVALALEVLHADPKASADANDLMDLLERAYNADPGEGKPGDEFKAITRGIANTILAMARRRVTQAFSLDDTPECVAAKLLEIFGLEYAEKVAWAIGTLIARESHQD